MKVVYAALVFAFLNSGCAGEKVPAKQPSLTIQVYTFDAFTNGPITRTEFFTFRAVGGGYELLRNVNGESIAGKIHYQKTFGGLPPTTEVHLIDKHLVIFPETIPGSAVSHTQFNDMMARTHVFDVRSGRLVYTSPPYQYAYDAPLKYDVHVVKHLASDARPVKSRKQAQKGVGGQPATQP